MNAICLGGQRNEIQIFIGRGPGGEHRDGVGFAANFLNMLKFPIAPLVIGVILGGLFDETFRRSLLISGGDLMVFASRPVAGILLVLNMALVAGQFPLVKRLFAGLRKRIA